MQIDVYAHASVGVNLYKPQVALYKLRLDIPTPRPITDTSLAALMAACMYIQSSRFWQRRGRI